MTAEKAPPEAVRPEAAKRRFAPKRMIAAAAATLLLLAGAGGAAMWLWPKAPDPDGAKAARLPAPTSTPVALPASAHAAASAAPVALEVPPHRTEQRTAADAGLGHLQRRLGEVLGGKGAIEATRCGDLQVVARGGGMVAVRHGDAPGSARSGPADEATPGARSHDKAGHGARWTYSGLRGPQAWGKLKPEFSQCAIGQRQSPIDIREGIALDLDPVQFDYEPSSFAVIDNGYTVQVNVAPGNSIEVNGRRYVLRQFHFHRPSEERINGRQFEMDAHLVHQDGEGRLAVVAVLLERGAAQPLLQTLWNHLPLEKNEEFAARTPIDLNQLLPTDRRYYTYMGSLTTPPCSEGVLWLVMQQPVAVSARQIDIFSRLYPMNARPIQRSAGRMIKQSN